MATERPAAEQRGPARGRGRPPHPDILTPAEWRVLNLLREGLSNPEIAGRLALSRDTVKTHVTAILSKLGVATREEAAAWQPAPERRPWWAAALAWLRPVTLGKTALFTATVAVVAGLGVLAWGVLRGSGDREAGVVETRTAPPGQTMSTKPATDDSEIWSAVLKATAGNISPVLRPTALSERFDTVWVDRLDATADARSFVVAYSGSESILRIGVGLFNPPPPSTRGSQQPVLIRGLECAPLKGKECVLQVDDSTNPKGAVWLWWNEPGRWVAEPGGAIRDSVAYLVWAEGIEQQEVMALAGSLRPAAEAGFVDTFVLMSFKRIDLNADPKGGGPVYIVDRDISIRTHSVHVKRIEIVAGVGSQDVAASAAVVPDDNGYATATLTLPEVGVVYGVQGYGILTDDSPPQQGEGFYGDERAVSAGAFPVIAEGP